MKIKPLPPLKSLVTFECAARHLNFTQAANELCVTQGAVSKQIRVLEEALGLELFIRGKRNLVLTSAGRRYHQSISKPLAALASATADMVRKNSGNHITIATISGLASQWLMPRFAKFEQSHAHVDVRIKIVESMHHVNIDEYDVGIFYSESKPAGFDSRLLFTESVFPVCSPEFLKTHPEIKDPDKLGASKLLIHDTREPWMNWHEWLISCDLMPVQESATQIEINDYPILIQAAINGQGIALAWENLVDEYIENGQLVAPISNKLATQSNFYAVTPSELRLKTEAKELIEFLSIK